MAWYTWNVARIAWREGNKGGGILVGALALVTFALPAGVLLSR